MSTQRDPVFGCELRTTKLDKDGYAFFGRSRAHIVEWEAANGRVPDAPDGSGKMEIDHLCRRRNCVALHHLELVTRAENEKRKSFKYRVRRARCPRGHELAINRIITPEGGIVCRACNREAERQSA